MPVSLFLEVLLYALQLLPEMEAIVPIIAQALTGVAPTAAQMAQLQQVAASMSAQVAAAEQAAAARAIA